MFRSQVVNYVLLNKSMLKEICLLGKIGSPKLVLGFKVSWIPGFQSDDLLAVKLHSSRISSHFNGGGIVDIGTSTGNGISV